MPITRDFRDTIQARAKIDPEFRAGLFVEAIQAMLSGDTDIGKSILRDYINATIGFDELSKLEDKSPKSLMRMLSSKGNPTAKNLFGIVRTLQEQEGLYFELKALR